MTHRIVIVGGGISGLGAADALTAAFAASSAPERLPEIVIVEGEREAGGRAQSWSSDEETFRADHPHAPFGVSSPHGLHLVWGSYAHFHRWTEGLGVALTPAGGTPTYNLWMAPPDLAGGPGAPARIAALHVCDPRRPESAWHPDARALLEMVRDNGPLVERLRTFCRRALLVDMPIDNWLSYLDILFDERTLSPQLRWMIFLSGMLPGYLGQPEDNPVLFRALGGRRPQDVDISELMVPLFDRTWIMPRVRRAHALLSRRRSGPPPRRAGDRHRETPLRRFMNLIARDARTILREIDSYDPRRSGYAKNILKLAFSSPYGLDVATAIRDAQFGLQSHDGALLQTFDGDDARALWRAVRERIEGRFEGGVRGRFLRSTWVSAVRTDADGVRSVALTTTKERAPSCVPTVEPVSFGPADGTLAAERVVAAILPQCLAPLLPDEEGTPFRRALRHLGGHMNETVNLQLFFPERIALPFVGPGDDSTEVPPFSISNLEGPFTMLMDLERAWSPEAFQRVRLRSTDGHPFAGTGWELVGAWADLFVHDPLAHPGRYQWPRHVVDEIRRACHRPDEHEPWSQDQRPWVNGGSAMDDPPVFGQIRAERRARYQARWRREVTPLVVASVLRQLAAMPGLDGGDARRLKGRADDVETGAPIDFCYVLQRNCHAENKFFSAEPGTFAHRPHARFETPVQGLWVAGDWTRNGCNGQSMESALVSGLQAAYGVIESLRGEGHHDLRVPSIVSSIMPPGAWDVGDLEASA